MLSYSLLHSSNINLHRGILLHCLMLMQLCLRLSQHYLTSHWLLLILVVGDVEFEANIAGHRVKIDPGGIAVIRGQSETATRGQLND